MKIMLSFLAVVLLLTAVTASATPQDKEQASPSFLEAFKTDDLNLRVEKLNEAIQEKPKYVPAHYYLGLTLSQLKRYDEALAAYQRLIQMPSIPGDQARFLAAAHYEIGKVFVTQTNFGAAAAEYRWLAQKGTQDGADELALYLSDLFPKPTAEHFQIPVSPMQIDNEQKAVGEKQGVVVQQKSADKRIVILYKEKARYTEIARINRVQGTVVLGVVFTDEGKVTNIRVIRGLADGLSRRAIEAAQKIRFEPAMRDGKPMTVAGNLEFTFNLF